MKIALAVIAALVCSTAALADDAPLLSGERLSIALQAGGAWQDEVGSAVLAVSPDYHIGSVALVFPLRYAFEGEALSWEPRLSVLVPSQGPLSVALQAGYAFADVDQGFVGASVTVPLGGAASKWALAFPALYFLDSEQARLEAKLSFLAGGN